ncbi:hypothetical protein CETAM_06165 [Corynebacterium comes]|uniref:Serine hydrolase n=1 Tax=Corynebacterium comes TaxID=2675218 RepID=A0A6B8VMZ9_9CORY|nr:hypothetical protein CETAM_06165 [Corynebacterium comes]
MGCAADVDEPAARVANVAPVAENGYLGPEELRQELRALIRDVNDEHGGRIGIAVATGEGVVHSGLSGNSWAWSTIKVPVAMAADDRGLATEELIEASISSSDNDAAYQLSVLIDGDYGNLRHAPTLADPPGETKWRLADQAQFAVLLPCTDTAGTTYGAMGEIVEWQQFGLANIPGAHFKGGWGYDTDTVYTLRQFGTADVDDGVVGLAIISHPDDGSHASAEEILDEVGSRLKELLDAHSIGPAATCPG